MDQEKKKYKQLKMVGLDDITKDQLERQYKARGFKTQGSYIKHLLDKDL
jgi:hypothetical protein